MTVNTVTAFSVRQECKIQLPKPIAASEWGEPPVAIKIFITASPSAATQFVPFLPLPVILHQYQNYGYRKNEQHKNSQVSNAGGNSVDKPQCDPFIMTIDGGQDDDRRTRLEKLLVVQ